MRKFHSLIVCHNWNERRARQHKHTHNRAPPELVSPNSIHQSDSARPVLLFNYTMSYFTWQLQLAGRATANIGALFICTCAERNSIPNTRWKTNEPNSPADCDMVPQHRSYCVGACVCPCWVEYDCVWVDELMIFAGNLPSVRTHTKTHTHARFVPRVHTI